ncbi:hypothetical protein PInf_016625 [Phytophthora infestans]|nr:hypothetical protein PInf_016625 [Phytophthora infestans]
MAKGQPTIPATPAKSGGARNESSSPAGRYVAATELSVSFGDEADIGADAHDYDDYEDKTPALLFLNQRYDDATGRPNSSVARAVLPVSNVPDGA